MSSGQIAQKIFVGKSYWRAAPAMVQPLASGLGRHGCVVTRHQPLHVRPSEIGESLHHHIGSNTCVLQNPETLEP